MSSILRSSTMARLLGLLALLALSVGVVSAHSDIKSATPAPGSMVESAPSAVTIVFKNHDPLDGSKSKISVTDASGKQVDKGDSALDKSDAERKTVTVSLNSGLADGVYTVNWIAVTDGADASTTEGSYTFGVGVTPMPATGMAGEPSSALLIGLGLLLLGTGLLIQRRGRRVSI